MTTATPLPRSRTLLAAACALLIALLGACSQTPPAPVVPDAPTASVSGAGTIELGESIALDASASTGEELDFSWSFAHTPTGAATVFSSTSGNSTSFTPSTAGTYVVEVEVSNPGGSDTAVAVVEVVQPDVSGMWSAVLTPVGDPPVPFTLNLIQSGSSLSGTLDTGGPTLPITGTIDGHDVTIVISSGGSTISIDATLNDPATGMTGSFVTNGAPPITGSFSATKM